MKVKLERKNQAFHFESKMGEHRVQVDGNPKIGGEDMGARPMEYILTGVAGCVSIDLGLILKKQRQELLDYNITVSGERNTDDAKAFKAIHLKFWLKGQLNEQKVERAIDLAINTYCSAIQSLDKKIKITSEFKIER